MRFWSQNWRIEFALWKMERARYRAYARRRRIVSVIQGEFDGTPFRPRWISGAF